MSITLCPKLAAAGQLPSWMTIKPGAVGYLNDEGAGGPNDPPGRRTVCENLVDYLHQDDDDENNASDRGCVVRRAFGLVRVVRIVAHAASITEKASIVLKVPIVAIKSLSAGWSGVVIGLALLPIAPIGTKLLLHRGDFASYSPLVTLTDKDTPADGFIVREHTRVEIVDRHVPDDEHYPIRVRILTGRHRNEKIWTELYTVPYGAFWMQDPANIVP